MRNPTADASPLEIDLGVKDDLGLIHKFANPVWLNGRRFYER
ncbi:MAG: hypothetical protein NTY15_04040 [Planctomycetota bacterium]|nr:hypothetical protein [Planctomycetota bacterium]